MFVNIESQDVTTVDPLNLALTAKSVTAKVWWSLVTVGAVLGLVVATGFLINAYNNRPTSAVIKVSQVLGSVGKKNEIFGIAF